MKQLTELKAGKTYVFIDDKAKSDYINWNSSNFRYFNDHYDNGFTLTGVDIGDGLINGNTVIARIEMKYFKLKGAKMKATDTINVTMTALQGLMLRVLIGKTSSANALYECFLDDVGLPSGALRITIDGARKWHEGGELQTWALAQFKDPKQDKIDELEKTINDAASELAKLKAGDL